MIRTNNDAYNAKTKMISEGIEAQKKIIGEQTASINDLAFLYFLQKVFGNETDQEDTREKIVVIDDPVSSIDSFPSESYLSPCGQI